MLRRVTALAPRFSRVTASGRRLLSDGVFGIPQLRQPQDFARLAANAIEKCEQIRRKVEGCRYVGWVVRWSGGEGS